VDGEPEPAQFAGEHRRGRTRDRVAVRPANLARDHDIARPDDRIEAAGHADDQDASRIAQACRRTDGPVGTHPGVHDAGTGGPGGEPLDVHRRTDNGPGHRPSLPARPAGCVGST
jgi:hypothetical protein